MADDTTRTRRRLPGWVLGTLGGILGVSAVGLPVALVVAALDVVRRAGSPLDRGVVLGGLVITAVVLVVGIERGLVYAARSGWSSWAILGTVLGVGAVVLAGVLLPGLGLVLVAVGVVLALLVAPVGLGLLAWWRWTVGGTAAARPSPTRDEVHERAEERRAIVRARHDLTRAAVAAGLIGPGFTRGRGRA